ncbi:MAG: hypothetical protein R6V04_06520 [bacterium]
MKKLLIITTLILVLMLGAACSRKSVETVELKHYPVDSLEGIISTSGLSLDTTVTSDGKGSLKVTTNKPTTVRLYETGDIEVEDTKLFYQAKLRTENVEGQVYIEMYCHFPGQGEFFSRAQRSSLSGTNNWTSQETPFILKKGQNPDNIKINLVIKGKGTVWIDDIRLLKAS